MRLNRPTFQGEIEPLEPMAPTFSEPLEALARARKLLQRSSERDLHDLPWKAEAEGPQLER